MRYNVKHPLFQETRKSIQCLKAMVLDDAEDHAQSLNELEVLLNTLHETLHTPAFVTVHDADDVMPLEGDDVMDEGAGRDEDMDGNREVGDEGPGEEDLDADVDSHGREVDRSGTDGASIRGGCHENAKDVPVGNANSTRESSEDLDDSLAPNSTTDSRRESDGLRSDVIPPEDLPPDSGEVDGEVANSDVMDGRTGRLDYVHGGAPRAAALGRRAISTDCDDGSEELRKST